MLWLRRAHWTPGPPQRHTDAMTKMLGTMEKLDTRLLEVTEKLNALIHVVDGMVRPQ